MAETDPAMAAGSPGSIQLGGRTYLVAQATDETLMVVFRYLQKHAPGPLDMLAEIAAHPAYALLPEEDRRQLAREAASKAVRREKDIPPEAYVDLLMEARHCRFLAWVLLREHQPALTLEELTALIPEAAAPAVFLQLQRECGMEALGKSLSRPGSAAGQTGASSTPDS